MSSKIFNALLEEKIEVFINAFKQTSRTVFFDEQKKRLIHSGEFGTFREKISKDFLKFFVPQNLNFGNGFIISPQDKVSAQCDIIIFDGSITPLIQANDLQTFYPVETVVGVGEIKSKMSKDELKEAINKLAKTKQIKSSVENPIIHKKRDLSFNSEKVLYDSIFTFLICEKFDFKCDNLESDIDSMYDPDIEYWHRHNLILSIEDGLLLYNLKLGNKTMVFYSPIFEGPNPNMFISIRDDRKYHHLNLFVLSLFDGISQATVLYPEMSHYIKDITSVYKIS